MCFTRRTEFTYNWKSMYDKVLVAQSCLILCDCMDHSLWGSSVCPWDFPGKNTGVGCHAFSKGSSRPRDWTQVSYISGSLHGLSHREANTLFVYSFAAAASQRKVPPQALLHAQTAYNRHSLTMQHSAFSLHRALSSLCFYQHLRLKYLHPCLCMWRSDYILTPRQL